MERDDGAIETEARKAVELGDVLGAARSRMSYRQIFAAVIGASISMSCLTAVICRQRPQAALNQRVDANNGAP
jgi:hypothetical protein